jgi:DNA mismatch repair ATPase MutS
MRKFENCVLLTRVGGFYELYFEHADEFGPLLNLKVAQKPTKAGPVPMVYSSKKTALARLMQTRPDSPSSNWIDISRFWCKI